MSEILSGGLNWGSTQQAIVTMDKEGHPLSCCNPVTGECLGGGGSSDFSTAEVTITATKNEDVIDSIYVLGFDTDYNVWTIFSIRPSDKSQTYQIVVPQSGFYIYGANGLLGNVSGNIRYDAEEEGYFITGDCAIELFNADIS